MKYIKIQNNGELDTRLISLMGGTTKTGSSYKIGRFGTGLKYSLSYLVRNNIDFKVFIGEREVKVHTVSEDIQGTKFDILYIDGQRTSITSTMGMDWEGWMIVREIWCNAIDEGGHERGIVTDDQFEGKEGATTFYLQLTGDIKAAVDNWDHYFLHGQTPLMETEEFAIYPAGEKLRLYKNGVLIHEEKEEGSVFSYDIKDADINEMREYKGYLTTDIYNILLKLDKERAEFFLSTLNKNHYEHGMDYQWGGKFGDAWKEAIGGAKLIATEDLESLKSRGAEIDESAMVKLPKSLFTKLAVDMPHVSAVRRSEKVSAFWESYDSELELAIKSALAILETAGYQMDPELKFLYGVFGDKRKLAQVNLDEKTVMFSLELKKQPVFMVVAAIIEENEHYATGFEDCSRSFQTHLLTLYAKQLLAAAEIKL